MDCLLPLLEFRWSLVVCEVEIEHMYCTWTLSSKSQDDE